MRKSIEARTGQPSLSRKFVAAFTLTAALAACSSDKQSVGLVPDTTAKCEGIELVNEDSSAHTVTLKSAYTLLDPSYKYFATTWEFTPANSGEPGITIDAATNPEGLIVYHFNDHIDAVTAVIEVTKNGRQYDASSCVQPHFHIS